MLPKKTVALIVVVVAALVAAAFLFGSWVLTLSTAKQNVSKSSDYSAVYLTSGDIYFGKLSWFPWPRLKNVWYIQRTVAPNSQSQLGVAPFVNAFWGPMDEVYLNPKEIIFWTRLRSDSQLVGALSNPSIVEQLQTQPPVLQTPPIQR